MVHKNLTLKGKVDLEPYLQFAIQSEPSIPSSIYHSSTKSRLGIKISIKCTYLANLRNIPKSFRANDLDDQTNNASKITAQPSRGAAEMHEVPKTQKLGKGEPFLLSFVVNVNLHHSVKLTADSPCSKAEDSESLLMHESSNMKHSSVST